MIKDKVLSVTPKTYANGQKTLYKVITGAGKEYTCFSDRIKDKIGQEIEFDVVEKEYNGEKQYTMNLPKEGGFSGGGYSKKPYSVPFHQTRDGAILSAKTMLLSYIKDGANAMLVPGTPSKDWCGFIRSSYKELLPLLELDKLSEVKEPVKDEPSTAMPHVSNALKPALVAILKEKFKGWSNISIVKFAGTVGLVIPHDPASGTVHWEQLLEEEANLLINELSKE